VNPKTRRIRKHNRAIRNIKVQPELPIRGCAEDIYRNGTPVFVTHSIGRPWTVEAWVRRIAKASGQKVDWHFVGGRVVVRALGDMRRIHKAIRRFMGEHDALYRKVAKKYGAEDNEIYPPRPGWWT
jgi:hypothetical protein